MIPRLCVGEDLEMGVIAKNIPLALAMGLMLSPESLTLLGNNMGIAGISFLVVVLSAMVVHLFTALSYGELFTLSPGPGGETRFIREALGSIPAIVLPLCSRVVFTICAATGILATAGYVFNEVFVNWFPNLGFSFCLLGFLLVTNLLGQRVSGMAQIIFVVVAVSGLIFLSAVGLIGLGNASPAVNAASHPPFNTPRVVLLGLVLFVGFDLAGLTKGSKGDYLVNLMGSMVAGIVVAGVVLCLWGLVSINYVALDRLADTTVPYAVAARAVLGQNGRICMGVIVLAGTCSAVNALLMAVSRMITGMVTQGLLPSFLGKAQDRAPVPLILLAVGIATMMAMGMAGEPVLEVYIRAGLLFWLLNYAAVHLSVLIMRRRIPNRSQLFKISGYPVVTIIGLLAMLIGIFGLLWSDSESVFLFKFMLVISAIASLFSVSWIAVSRRKGWLTPTGLIDR